MFSTYGKLQLNVSIIPTLKISESVLNESVLNMLGTICLNCDRTCGRKYYECKGLSMCHHFEFNYILNLYALSMCFVR